MMDDRLNNTMGDGELQRGLLQLDEAERAGVFQPTPLDAMALMAVPAAKARASRRWVTMARVGIPIAACVAVWFGVSELGLWSGDVAVPGTVAVSNMNGALAEGDSECIDFTRLNSCYTGPYGDALSHDCACADLDRDGDVDFADFGRFQRMVTPQRG